MPIDEKQPNKALGKLKKTEKESIEHDLTHGQIGDTTVSDMPKKGEQTGRTHEEKAGKGY